MCGANGIVAIVIKDFVQHALTFFLAEATFGVELDDALVHFLSVQAT